MREGEAEELEQTSWERLWRPQRLEGRGGDYGGEMVPDERGIGSWERCGHPICKEELLGFSKCKTVGQDFGHGKILDLHGFSRCFECDDWSVTIEGALANKSNPSSLYVVSSIQREESGLITRESDSLGTNLPHEIITFLLFRLLKMMFL